MNNNESGDVEVQIPQHRVEVSRDVRTKISQRDSIVARLAALNVETSQLNTLTIAHLEAKLSLIDRYYNSYDELQTQLEIGCQREWLDFYNTFVVLVDQNPDLVAVEKFQYLRSSLTGPAARLIQSLEVTSANYQKALELLGARYDNKRIIFQSHLQHIFESQRLVNPNVANIRDFIDKISSNMRAMQTMANKTQISDGLILYLVVSKLDHNTQMKWEEEIAARWDREAQSQSLRLPTWEDLMKFLERRCQLIDMVDIGKEPQKPLSGTAMQASSLSSKGSKPTKQLSFVATHHQQKCNLCDEPVSHNAFNCTTFSKLTPSLRYDLAKKKMLCLNCLGLNHTSKKCPSSRRCQICQGSHHTLLHRSQPTTSSPLQSSDQVLPSSSSSSSSTLNSSSKPTVLQVCYNTDHILLATAIVQLCNPSGISIHARVLLDSASQLHFMTERIAQLLRVNRKRLPLEISGIGMCGTKSQHICKVELRARYASFATTIDAVIVQTITSCQPRTTIDISAWDIPKNITLADEGFYRPGPVDILLGASVFYDLLMVGQIRLCDELPLLQKTKLGWVVAGAVTNHSHLSSATLISSYTTSVGTDCLLSTTNLSQSPIDSSQDKTENLSLEPSCDAIMERFWQLEQHSQQSKLLTMDETECENYFRDTTKRCANTGKFIVRLPFKEAPQLLGSSHDIALRRFLSTEARLRRNKDLQIDYTAFMQEYIDLGHMIHLPLPSNAVHYIPHHAVLKLDSSTTKLRVVFDASCRTTSGKSLNDLLRVGPTIQDDVFSILLRFRIHPFVLMADIAKMYRQILVDENDAKYQCIFWRDSDSGKFNTYQLQTVTYGTACAPYLATKCLQQLADEHASEYPIGSLVVRRDFYVDNLMTGASPVQEVIEIKNQVVAILSHGGFPLRKFASNDVRAMSDIPQTEREDIYQLDDIDYIKALGLRWSPSSDCFLFKYTQPPLSSKATKRNILSHIARFFDPLGLLNPIIVSCKILMQKLWKLQLNWDESVPSCLHTEWQSFCAQLPLVENLRVTRLVPFAIEYTLHAFADASIKAYGACIYTVSSSEGSYQSALMCAKSRVAPTKEVNLPRLELCAALLLSELLDSVYRLLHPHPSNVHCWTDSTVALAWINGEPSKWATFVSNRVSMIQTRTSRFQWHHVPGELNPADILSRGATPKNLVDNNLWFNGPKFITLPNEHWPHVAISLPEVPEQRKQITVLISRPAQDIVAELKIVNNYNKVIRTFCYVQRFIDACRVKGKRYDLISVAEMNKALHTICRIIQSQIFFEERKQLESDNIISRSSSLAQLSPFLHDGLIRVGGRLSNSNLPFEEKHPILLPKSHPFIATIISHLHRQHLHAANQALHSIIRERFWVVNARNLIRKVIHKCLTCYRFRPVLAEQVMGSLPKDRVTQSYPFEVTGVDYCGPLLMTQQIRGKIPLKVYIAVFICFSSKAIHLELVPDLTSAAFIAALKRFISRRGRCQVIYSDNATNFVGANRELRNLLHQFMSQQHYDEVQQACCVEGIEWKFIPPRSPHFGGLWESAVKQAKHYLSRAIGVHILTHDELHTLCCQAEAIINSRPLTPITSSPNDMRPITPAHLLIGRSLTSIPEPSLSSSNPGALRRYQLSQWIQQQFWERWSKEYLRELQQRKKWKTQLPNLQQNDLVLLQEDKPPPLKWPMGRVVEVITGTDGKVRVALVKTATGVHRRAITRLAKLPIENDTTSVFQNHTSHAGEDVEAPETSTG